MLRASIRTHACQAASAIARQEGWFGHALAPLEGPLEGQEASMLQLDDTIGVVQL